MHERFGVLEPFFQNFVKTFPGRFEVVSNLKFTVPTNIGKFDPKNGLVGLVRPYVIIDGIIFAGYLTTDFFPGERKKR